MFVDSVNFIVNTCDIKNYIYQYLLLKEVLKLHQLPNSFEINSEACLKEL